MASGFEWRIAARCRSGSAWSAVEPASRSKFLRCPNFMTIASPAASAYSASNSIATRWSNNSLPSEPTCQIARGADTSIATSGCPQNFILVLIPAGWCFPCRLVRWSAHFFFKSWANLPSNSYGTHQGPGNRYHSNRWTLIGPSVWSARPTKMSGIPSYPDKLPAARCNSDFFYVVRVLASTIAPW